MGFRSILDRAPSQTIKTPVIPSTGAVPTSTDVKKLFDALRTYFNEIDKNGGIVTDEGATAAARKAISTVLPEAVLSSITGAVPESPIAVTGFSAVGGYSTIILTWDDQTNVVKGINRFIIYRSTTDDFGTAVEVLQAPGSASMIIDYPPSSSDSVVYYYWIKMEMTNGALGPLQAVPGESASTAASSAYALEMLANQIGYGQFDVASGVFPVRVVSALPTLPDADYPASSVVLLTTDDKMYRNSSDVWVLETVAEEQIEANAITAGKIAAGAIIASHIGTNEIIANSANIGTAVIEDVHVNQIGADKLYVSSGTIADVIIGTAEITNAMVGDLQSSQLYAGNPAWSISKSGALTLRNTDGTILLQSGGTLSVLMENIADAGAFATLDQITAANISTYIASVAIGEAYIADAAVSSLKIAGNSVVIPDWHEMTSNYSHTFTSVTGSAWTSYQDVFTPFTVGSLSQPIAVLINTGEGKGIVLSGSTTKTPGSSGLIYKVEVSLWIDGVEVRTHTITYTSVSVAESTYEFDGGTQSGAILQSDYYDTANDSVSVGLKARAYGGDVGGFNITLVVSASSTIPLTFLSMALKR